MASIKIDSKLVIEACEKNIRRLEKIKSELNKPLNEPSPTCYGRPLDPHTLMQINACNTSVENIKKIKILSEYAKSYGGNIHLDQQDFALIGKYLPKPTTYP